MGARGKNDPPRWMPVEPGVALDLKTQGYFALRVRVLGTSAVDVDDVDAALVGRWTGLRNTSEMDPSGLPRRERARRMSRTQHTFQLFELRGLKGLPQNFGAALRIAQVEGANEGGQRCEQG